MFYSVDSGEDETDKSEVEDREAAKRKERLEAKEQAERWANGEDPETCPLMIREDLEIDVVPATNR